MAVLEPPEPPNGESLPQAIGSLYAAIAEAALSPSDAARERLANASSRLARLGFTQDKLKKLFRVQNSEFAVNREPSRA